MLNKDFEGVDLVVFPEYALTSTKILGLENIIDYAQEIPKHEFQACKGPKIFWSVLEHISCLALEFRTNLIINIVTRYRFNQNKPSGA